MPVIVKVLKAAKGKKVKVRKIPIVVQEIMG